MATTQAIFRASKDAGEPLDITQELSASDLIRYTVPAGGPFVTGAPQSNTLTQGAEVLLSPLATIAANTLTDPMTVANVLLFTEVSEGAATANLGPAVERQVITANRNQTVVFGDLHFMCPLNGGSSLQMRRGSNPSMTVTHFSTKWSNQQGGASEQAPNFTVTTSWRHFRSAGLNLTQHNNWQEGTFVCNGWLYRIQVIVGLSWNINRFSCTRWRLDGVQGDAGINGVNGVNGVDAASIDHVSKTAGDSSPGTTDTYTLWADAGETSALGTYDVPIPASAVVPADVLIDASPDNTSTLTSYNFALGMTYGEFKAKYASMRISIGFNNLYSDAMSESYVLADFAAGTDLAVQEYTVHSANAYHIKATVPADSATTLRLYAEGSAGFHHATLRANEKSGTVLAIPVDPGPSNSAGVHSATRLHANVSTNDTSYALSAERIALEDPTTGQSIVTSVGGSFFNAWSSTAEGFRDLYLWSNEAGNNLEITDVDRAAVPVAPADKPFGGFVGTVQFTAAGVLKTMLQSGDTFSFAPTQIWDATGFVQQFPNAFAAYATIAPTNAKAILFGHISLELQNEVKEGVALVFAQDNVSLAGQRQMISESNKDRVAFASGWWTTHAQQQSLVWGVSNNNTDVMQAQAFISAYRV